MSIYKKTVSALVLSTLICSFVTAPAAAHDYGWKNHRGQHHRHHGDPYRHTHHSKKGDSLRTGLAIGALTGAALFLAAATARNSAPVYTNTTYSPPPPPPVVTTTSVYYPTTPQPIQAGMYDNRYCREFTQNVMVGNRIQSGYGVACRQPDGSWEIVQ